MIKKRVAICVVLVAAVTGIYGQSRSKRVRQPREVVEAFRVCAQFRSLLAENLEFDRAFEATFTRDAARRRQIASAQIEVRDLDLSQVDTSTLVEIYKHQAQLLVLFLPMMFATDERQAELFPPPIEAMFDRKRPKDPRELQAFAAQLKRDVAEFRAHFDKLVVNNSFVAQRAREYKNYLLKPVEPPKRVVKPLTAYSNQRVLRPDEQYYQIDDCVLVRESGEMRIIAYTLVKFRW